MAKLANLVPFQKGIFYFKSTIKISVVDEIWTTSLCGLRMDCSTTWATITSQDEVLLCLCENSFNSSTLAPQRSKLVRLKECSTTRKQILGSWKIFREKSESRHLRKPAPAQIFLSLARVVFLTPKQDNILARFRARVRKFRTETSVGSFPVRDRN